MRFLLGLILFLATASAGAQLSIEITGAGAQRTPIAIVPFTGETSAGTTLTAIVRADLERSGLFRGLEVPPLSPHPNENSPVNYGEWRSRLADAVVLGSVAPSADGRFEVRFRVYDIVKQAPLGAIAYLFTKDNARAAAHRIADFVYEKLTGEKGVFSTQIA
jgi:TolB protein